MAVPEEAALLPFEEKAKLVVELRRQGKTYREIAKVLRISPRDMKRALKLEVRKDEVGELKARVDRLEGALRDLESPPDPCARSSSGLGRSVATQNTDAYGSSRVVAH